MTTTLPAAPLAHWQRVLSPADRWRTVFVATVHPDGGWLVHTDRAPFGLTLRPGQCPGELRQHLAEAWGWPLATLHLFDPDR